MLILSGDDSFLRIGDLKKLSFAIHDSEGGHFDLEGLTVTLLIYLDPASPTEVPCTIIDADDGTFETTSEVDTALWTEGSYDIVARVEEEGAPATVKVPETVCDVQDGGGSVFYVPSDYTDTIDPNDNLEITSDSTPTVITTHLIKGVTDEAIVVDETDIPEDITADWTFRVLGPNPVHTIGYSNTYKLWVESVP